MDEKEAEHKYGEIMDEMAPLVGTKTTYMNDLDLIGRTLFGLKWKGVFPSDKIPKLTKTTPYCILNLDESHEPGSHWIALARVNKGEAMVYDSFGRPYKDIIPVLEKSKGLILDTDLDAEQNIAETNCGLRCMAWLAFFDEYGADAAALI
jgi:hypothetical protein